MHIKSGDRMLHLPALVRHSDWMSNCPNTRSVDRNTPVVPYALNIGDGKIDLAHYDVVFGKEKDRHMDNTGERVGER